jgi:hypothetical protein
VFLRSCVGNQKDYRGGCVHPHSLKSPTCGSMIADLQTSTTNPRRDYSARNIFHVGEHVHVEMSKLSRNGGYTKTTTDGTGCLRRKRRNYTVGCLITLSLKLVFRLHRMMSRGYADTFIQHRVDKLSRWSGRLRSQRLSLRSKCLFLGANAL